MCKIEESVYILADGSRSRVEDPSYCEKARPPRFCTSVSRTLATYYNLPPPSTITISTRSNHNTKETGPIARPQSRDGTARIMKPEIIEFGGQPKKLKDPARVGRRYSLDSPYEPSSMEVEVGSADESVSPIRTGNPDTAPAAIEIGPIYRTAVPIPDTHRHQAWSEPNRIARQSPSLYATSELEGDQLHRDHETGRAGARHLLRLEKAEAERRREEEEDIRFRKLAAEDAYQAPIERVRYSDHAKEWTEKHFAAMEKWRAEERERARKNKTDREKLDAEMARKKEKEQRATRNTKESRPPIRERTTASTEPALTDARSRRVTIPHEISRRGRELLLAETEAQIQREREAAQQREIAERETAERTALLYQQEKQQQYYDPRRSEVISVARAPLYETSIPRPRGEMAVEASNIPPLPLKTGDQGPSSPTADRRRVRYSSRRFMESSEHLDDEAIDIEIRNTAVDFQQTGTPSASQETLHDGRDANSRSPSLNGSADGLNSPKSHDRERIPSTAVSDDDNLPKQDQSSDLTGERKPQIAHSIGKASEDSELSPDKLIRGIGLQEAPVPAVNIWKQRADEAKAKAYQKPTKEDQAAIVDKGVTERKNDASPSSFPAEINNTDNASEYGENILFDPLSTGLPISMTMQDPPPAPKGILRKPREKFPEDPRPIREGVAPHKGVSKGKDIPIGARWTKIDRRLVNPEALEEAKERFEERMDCVIVLRVLSRQEIQNLADRTKKIREIREEEYERRDRLVRLNAPKNTEEEDRDYDRITDLDILPAATSFFNANTTHDFNEETVNVAEPVYQPEHDGPSLTSFATEDNYQEDPKNHENLEEAYTLWSSTQRRFEVEDDGASIVSRGAPSIFSVATGPSAITTDTQYSEAEIASATQQLVTILCKDELLKLLFKEAIQKETVGPDRFSRNFRRLLKIYSQELKEDAGENIQYLAAQLVQWRARKVAEMIKQKYMQASTIVRSAAPMDDESSDEQPEESRDDNTLTLSSVEDFLTNSEAFGNLKAELERFVRVPQVRQPVVKSQEIDEIVSPELPYRTEWPPKRWPFRSIVTVFSVLGLIERPLQPGKQRVRWKCRCGKSLYDDYTELKAGALDDLRERLASFSMFKETAARQHQDQNSSMLKGAGSISAFFNGVSNRMKAGRTKSMSGPSIPFHNKPAVQGRNVTAGTKPEPDPIRLLVCMNESKFGTNLYQEDICGLKNDRCLFEFLQDDYTRRRGKIYSFLSLRSPESIDLVKFNLVLEKHVDVRKHQLDCIQTCLCLPPPEKVEPEANAEYRCNPIPPSLSPPLGSQLLMHLFSHPECLKDEKQAWILAQFPKKLRGTLVGTYVGPVPGWGIHFKEGWNWDRIKVILVAYLGVSFVFGIAWAVRRHDVQGAFGVAGYLVSTATVFLGYIAMRHV